MKLVILLLLLLYRYGLPAQEKYDVIYIATEKFTIAKQNGEVLLIDSAGRKQQLKKFKAVSQVFQYSKYYQLAAGDKLKWLNSKGEFLDSVPVESVTMNVCGTVSRTFNTILKRNDSTFILFKSTSPFEDMDNTGGEKYIATSGKLLFLNDTESLLYRGYDGFATGLESNLFFEKMPGGKINVVRINYSKAALKKEFVAENIDSVCTTVPVFFFTVYQPFRFIKQQLYGYYPMMTEGRYSQLSNFEYNFARFTLPNGKKGWLDKYGKEYFD